MPREERNRIKRSNSFTSIETRRQKNNVIKEIRKRDKELRTQFKDYGEKWKVQRELNNKKNGSMLNNLQAQNIVNKFKNKIYSELDEVKKEIVSLIEKKLGFKILSSTIPFGNIINALLGNKQFQLASLLKKLEQLIDTMEKVKKVTSLEGFTDLLEKKETEAQKRDREYAKKQTLFAKMKSSWLNTAAYDDINYTVYFTTKPNKKNVVYSFAVYNVNWEIWEMLQDSNSAGKTLWNTVWYSKRTKSVGSAKYSGRTRVYGGGFV